MTWATQAEALTPILIQHFRGRNKTVFVPKIIGTLARMEKYWPLTVRQVFYQLVAGLMIENDRNSYQRVSKQLAKLRRLGIVPWKSIQDRTRRLTEKRGFEDVNSYLSREIDSFFDGYDRCLVQNQENYVEIFTEKDALAGLIEQVAWIYCLRIVVCRGQISATFLKDYADRAKDAIRRGKQPVILYFGDLDPSGARIPVSISQKLYDHHRLNAINVIVDRIALNEDQVEKYQLPHSFDAIKKTDPNYEWYVKKHGQIAVELDSLHPKQLQELVRHGLGLYLDVEDMQLQQGIESKERRKMKQLKERFIEIAKDEGINL